MAAEFRPLPTAPASLRERTTDESSGGLVVDGSGSIEQALPAVVDTAAAAVSSARLLRDRRPEPTRGNFVLHKS